MERKLTLLNKEIDSFFEKNFPLKKKSFKDEEDIFNYYITNEGDLTKSLNNVLSNIKEIPFKTKEFAQYLLKENLIASFDETDIGKSINKKSQKCYEDIRKEVLKKISFEEIKNQRNIKELISFLTSEIINLESKFYDKLEDCFSNRKAYPDFLIDKYIWLIKDKYLTKASSQGINISKMVYSDIKNNILQLFEKIFINKEQNMFLSKSKEESYKKYLDFIMICNKDYFNKPNVKDIFSKHFNYFYYLFNLDELNKKKDSNEAINQMLNQLFEENVSINEEEAKKKLNLILNDIGSDQNKILSIILCITLIFNGIIIKDVSKELILISNVDKLIKSAKMKVILYNSMIPFEKYLDVNDLCDFCQSIVINNYLPEKNNQKYEIREIKEILVNLGNDTKDSNKIQISLKSKEIFDQLKVDKKLKILNILENIASDKKEINISSINLESLNPKTKSTNCIIFVSGFLSDNEDHIEEWENFSLFLNKTNICYYYNWPSESILSTVINSITKVGGLIKNAIASKINKEESKKFHPEEIFVTSSKKAKLCGKILALIIASRAFFEYQTITLIGFSLGTHVISNCIKKLYKISSDIKCDDIIKDVILIAGATSMKGKEDHYTEMFDKIVNGKIFNCWSQEDVVLSSLYTFAMKKIPIGISGDLNLKTDKFKNIDFTPLKLGHTDYRKRMDLVMSKIQLSS